MKDYFDFVLFGYLYFVRGARCYHISNSLSTNLHCILLISYQPRALLSIRQEHENKLKKYKKY